MSVIPMISEHVRVDLSSKIHWLKVQAFVWGDETGIPNPDSIWLQNALNFKFCKIGPEMIEFFLLFASHYVSIIKLCQDDVRPLDSFIYLFISAPHGMSRQPIKLRRG